MGSGRLPRVAGGRCRARAYAILKITEIGTEMSKLRVSVVEFLNTAPLVWGFTEGPLAGKYDLSFTVPSRCAEALRTGEADLAIIPSIEYQRIADVIALPEIAIAAKGAV